jgi:hypothetical protein
MKKYLILFIFPIVLAGCVASGSLPGLQGTTESAIERDKAEFLELNNGTIIEGNLEKTPGVRILGGGNFIMDGKKYEYAHVVALQKGNIYYRKSPYRKWFGERIVRGKISGYRVFDTGEGASPNGSTHTFTFYRYFIQKGEKSPLMYYEVKTLKSMLTDDVPAMDAFNKYDALSKKQKKIKGDALLMDAIRIYNNRS